jgi:Flp pilus assembly protein TadD
MKRYKLSNTEMIWISEMKAEGAVNPTRLDFEIAKGMNHFFDSQEKGVIFIDCFGYLVLSNGFDKVRKFIKKLNDTASLNDATVLVSINPEAFTKETVMTLSRDFDSVEDLRKRIQRVHGQRCPSCGNVNPNNASNCSLCGAGLGTSGMQAETKPESPEMDSELPPPLQADPPTQQPQAPPAMEKAQAQQPPAAQAKAPTMPQQQPGQKELPDSLAQPRTSWYNKGVAFDRQKRTEEAIDAYNKALEINPHDVRSLFNKGVDLQMLGRTDEALACYETALSVTPNDAEIWSNKGIALRMMGRTDEAVQCYDRAIELNPRDAGVWSNRGVALRAVGRMEEAIQSYNRALDINPNDAGVWSNKGVALHKLGNLKEAVECYDRALALDPNRSVPRKNREVALRELGGRR